MDSAATTRKVAAFERAITAWFVALVLCALAWSLSDRGGRPCPRFPVTGRDAKASAARPAPTAQEREELLNLIDAHGIVRWD